MAKNPRLVYVSELIQQFASSQGDAHPTPYTRILYNIEEGTVILNPSETIQHSAVLDRLTQDFGKAEDISPNAIEQALNWAILFALDTQEKRQDLSLEQRIKIATNELQQKLTQPATYHECYIPIGGIDPQSLPWRFGLVTFLLFNESQIAKFRRAIRKHLVSDEQMSVRQIAIRDMRKYNIWNSPCARVRVKAKEPRAAIALASKHVRVTVDCINFLGDSVPYNFGWLYFPGEAASVPVWSPVLSEDGSFLLHSFRKGPEQHFFIGKLKDTTYLQPFARKIDGLLKRSPRRDIDELYLSAIQWAGRATVEPRREEAFLLFAIALESLILPTSDPIELTYRLRIRTAHLLGATARERERISDETRKLYGIRSNIVHNGYYQITEVELARIKRQTKQAIFALLSSRTAQSCKDKKELNKWFENKILS